MSEIKSSARESSEVVYKDQSIHEPTTAHQHPIETIPQGSQSDGVLNGHDKSDVNSGALARSALGLLALIVFSLVSMWFMMNWMLVKIAVNDTVPSQTFVERAPARSAWPIEPTDTPLQAPNETPALMPDPETPMVELREQDDAKLKGLDYVKDEQGRTTGVTLPIERAMDLTIERGLPSDNLTSVKLEKPNGEVVALGEIPYNKKVLKAEELKRGKKPVNLAPKNAETAKTTTMSTPVGQPKTLEGQPNTRSKMDTSTDKRPNTQVGAVREKVN